MVLTHCEKNVRSELSQPQDIMRRRCIAIDPTLFANSKNVHAPGPENFVKLYRNADCLAVG